METDVIIWGGVRMKRRLRMLSWHPLIVPHWCWWELLDGTRWSSGLNVVLCMVIFSGRGCVALDRWTRKYQSKVELCVVSNDNTFGMELKEEYCGAISGWGGTQQQSFLPQLQGKWQTLWTERVECGGKIFLCPFVSQEVIKSCFFP